MPNVSITGEVSFFKVPDNSLNRSTAAAAISTTTSTAPFNFTNNFGAQVGLKSIDVDYFSDLDAGNFSALQGGVLLIGVNHALNPNGRNCELRTPSSAQGRRWSLRRRSPSA